MTRISGPIDYSDGYPPRRRSSAESVSTSREDAPRAERHTERHTERRAESHADAARDFAREARRQRHTRHRARRVLPPQESDAKYSDAEHFARGGAPRARHEVLRHERHDAPNAPAPEHSAQAEQILRQRALQRKARRQPLVKWARRVAALVLIAGAGAGVYTLLTAPEFQVQRVEVEGAQVTSHARIAAITAPLNGQNWIRAHTATVAKRLESLPPVREARVTRKFAWPPQLVAHIVERQPFARVGAGNNWWVVDETGVPFRRADKRDDGLYAITSPKFAPRAGQALQGEAWRKAAAITRALEASKQRGQSWSLRRVYLDEDNCAALRLAGGSQDEVLVRLGEGQWPEKLERAHQALEYFDRTGQRAQTLNLVSYNRPAWTPRSAAIAANSAKNSAGDAAEFAAETATG